MPRLIRRLLKRFTRSLRRSHAVHIPVLASDLLRNRIALITGATSGIGLAIAEAFLRSGATVVLAGRSNERVQAACSQLSQLQLGDGHGGVFGVLLDVSVPSTHAAALENISHLLSGKPLDILVNNAGVHGVTHYGRVTEAEYDTVLDTNLRGSYLLTQGVALGMVRAQVAGNILNISSSSSLRPANSPYTLSKWAMRGWTLGLAKTLISHGIVVNGLAPGPTATRMLVADSLDGIELSASPIGRYATPSEIAQMAVVLVSGLGRMVVGDTVFMTGGAGLLSFDDVKYELHGL